jgi:hypothetical protein
MIKKEKKPFPALYLKQAQKKNKLNKTHKPSTERAVF